MRIEQLQPNDIAPIALDFSKTFENWSIDQSMLYLKSPYEISPTYCLKCIIEKNLAGGIFCKLAPYQDDKMIVIEALHVLKKFREHGVGKALMMAIVQLGKQNNIKKIGMLAPVKDEFPISWYKEIGFAETGWVEMEADVDSIEI